MSGLDFLSPGLARLEGGFEPVSRSPLERALRDAPPGIRDLSHTGKLDVRGPDAEVLDSGELGDGVEVVRITPERALLLCPPEDIARLLEQLNARARSVVDVTSALAGLHVSGEQLLRRLTDLDLDALPAVGSVAHIPATLVREGDEFRLFFPQEYADHVAAVVLDAAAGLR